MTEYFIAIAPKGQEFFHKTSNMIAVPKSTGSKIAQFLTDIKYQIKDNEVWHLYKNDFYMDDFIEKEIKRFGKRIIVYSYR